MSTPQIPSTLTRRRALAGVTTVGLALPVLSACGDDSDQQEFGAFTDCATIGRPVVTNDPRGDQRRTNGTPDDSAPQGDLVALRLARGGDRLCAEFGLTRDDCVAYGDSLSDKDLFAAVPVSVAVNSDRHLSGLATHSYVGKDLWDAYELARHAL